MELSIDCVNTDVCSCVQYMQTSANVRAKCVSTLVCLTLSRRSCGVQEGSSASVASVMAVWFRLSWTREGGAERKYSTMPLSLTLV